MALLVEGGSGATDKGADNGRIADIVAFVADDRRAYGGGTCACSDLAGGAAVEPLALREVLAIGAVTAVVRAYASVDHRLVIRAGVRASGDHADECEGGKNAVHEGKPFIMSGAEPLTKWNLEIQMARDSGRRNQRCGGETPKAYHAWTERHLRDFKGLERRFCQLVTNGLAHALECAKISDALADEIRGAFRIQRSDLGDF